MKKTVSRTKICKRRRILFTVLSTLIWVGIAVFSLIVVVNKASGAVSSENKYFEVKESLIALGITIIIALLLSLFMSNKLRTTIYMLSVIIAAIIFGNVAMYIEFGLWLVDEYIFKPIAEHYKAAYIANREIDKRSE